MLKKNEPNDRLIKKEKNQTICSKNVKGGTRRKPIVERRKNPWWNPPFVKKVRFQL